MPRALGLDFGTTNTVLFSAEGQGAAAPVIAGNADNPAQRSALCFWEDEDHPRKPFVEAGTAAITQFLEHADECRFLQSMKTFSASKSFQRAMIFGQRYGFDDLLFTYIDRLRSYADGALDVLPERVVVGRPVEYAGHNPDPELAMERYKSALTRLGFSEVLFVLEPVAAAFFYARTLSTPTNVLVADFGGGTSDFSVMRFEPNGAHPTAVPIGQGGVGVAGDNFDYRIINHVILPELGKGSRFDSMGKTLTFPDSYFSAFSRWNQLSIFKTSPEFRDFQKLHRYAHDPEKIGRLIDFVEEEQGYALYQAVSDAKARLSGEAEVTLRFPPLGDDFRPVIKRADFEGWIARDLEKISTALEQTLTSCGVSHGEIDKVFLTGGSSFVPAVRQIFSDRFGPERIETGDELLSIAHGLAIIGAREDAADWATV